MRIQSLTRAAAIAFASAGIASAQNDECATAIAVALNAATAFDTTTATLSPELWPCAAAGAPDLWYTYTAASNSDLVISLCGSSYDTALEVFTGACGALTSVVCNDDSCGLQSEVIVTGVTSGTVYTFRVGGWSNSTGVGTVTVSEFVPPPPPPGLPSNCVETLFASNNGGNTGGAVYFDVTATQNVTISGLLTNTSAVAGTPIGLSVYTTPMGYAGNETNAAAWTLVAEDDGTPVSLGDDQMTPVNFLAPLVLPAGTTGIALVGNNLSTGLQMDHDYTNGTGANQAAVSQDGVLSLSLGTASNAPFVGGIFSPRVWNGRMCHGTASPGTNYCGPAVANSTGNSAVMGASGSADLAANDLVLEASDLPNNAFAFFLTSQTQGTTPMAGGSTGTLCLGGQIGRFVGAGQIQNSGTTGMVSLAVDNSQQPTPTGLVQINAGETWSFQCWFRDAVGGMATSNFTDGLEITFN